jgi:hypothetical protein
MKVQQMIRQLKMETLLRPRALRQVFKSQPHLMQQLQKLKVQQSYLIVNCS